MELQFWKMEGIGNDFILIDDRDFKISRFISYEDLSLKLCDRNFGVGGDGLIVALGSEIADLKFRIFNSDGTEPQMCGNGMRCFAKFVYELNIVEKKRFRVETLAGTVIPEVFTDDQNNVKKIRVDMGEPVLQTSEIPFISEQAVSGLEKVMAGGEEYDLIPVSMGNPHAVVFTEDLDSVPIELAGPQIESCDRFPEKTNVEFVKVISPGEISFKVWERGAGITLACGTGACAVLVAASISGRTGDKALVHLPGGDLMIEWDRQSNHLFKTGPARLVFKGCMDLAS